jgi:hypothetical protein
MYSPIHIDNNFKEISLPTIVLLSTLIMFNSKYYFNIDFFINAVSLELI